MPAWTRKLTVIGGETRPDDWSISRDGERVGRCYQTWQNKWLWASITYPASSGHANSVDEALEALREAAGDLPVPDAPGRQQQIETENTPAD